MNKRIITALAGLLLVSCSSTPDGIDNDAMAPYCIAPRTLLCNTTRALGTAAFSPNNNSLLYYEMDNKEDKEAYGRYQRTSEEEATITIHGDDVYTVEYKLFFKTPKDGTVEETFTYNGAEEKYKGRFMLR